jgi:hypothetical membrane protein
MKDALKGIGIALLCLTGLLLCLIGLFSCHVIRGEQGTPHSYHFYHHTGANLAR